MQGVHEILSMMGETARDAATRALQFRFGEIASYDPENAPGVVTVKYKPDDTLSGDMPLATTWSGSPEVPSGALGGPELGSQVIVLAFDLEWTHTIAVLATWSNTNPPPPVPAGEYWVFHKAGSYVKLDNEERVRIHGPVQVDLIAPLVQFTDSLAALGPEKSVVRKEDLQALIDWINNSLIPWIKNHAHVGNLGSPTTSPITAALLLDKSAASASSIAKAK